MATFFGFSLSRKNKRVSMTSKNGIIASSTEIKMEVPIKSNPIPMRENHFVIDMIKAFKLRIS